MLIFQLKVKPGLGTKKRAIPIGLRTIEQELTKLGFTKKAVRIVAKKIWQRVGSKKILERVKEKWKERVTSFKRKNEKKERTEKRNAFIRDFCEVLENGEIADRFLENPSTTVVTFRGDRSAISKSWVGVKDPARSYVEILKEGGPVAKIYLAGTSKSEWGWGEVKRNGELIGADQQLYRSLKRFGPETVRKGRRLIWDIFRDSKNPIAIEYGREYRESQAPVAVKIRQLIRDTKTREQVVGLLKLLRDHKKAAEFLRDTEGFIQRHMK